jgi:hypothetical protein
MPRKKPNARTGRRVLTRTSGRRTGWDERETEKIAGFHPIERRALDAHLVGTLSYP